MDDDCRNHTQTEFLTDSARIALLEHCVGVLQDQVAGLLARLDEYGNQLCDIRWMQPRIDNAVEDAMYRIEHRIAELNGQLIDIRATQPKEISDVVNEAVDVIGVTLTDLTRKLNELRMSVEHDTLKIYRRLGAMESRFNAWSTEIDPERIIDRLDALEASDKQTVRHGMDNDTDLADIRRRLAALERQQPPDLNAEQVAYIVGLGGGIAWGGTE